MGHRGKGNDPADLFGRLQTQIDGLHQRATDLTDFVWENLPVELPEVVLGEDAEFLPLVVIAAVNAPVPWIDYATASPYGFVCDGIDDEVQFLEAEDVLSQLLVVSDSIIWLSPGDFTFNAGFNDLAGEPWGILSNRYKGHNIGVLGFDFTTINVTTGWDIIPEQDPVNFPGVLTNPLQLVGDFEDITINLIPNGLTDGDIPIAVSATGKIANVVFNIGSVSPVTFPVACDVALSLIGGENCTATVYRQGIVPSDAYCALDDVIGFTLTGAFDAAVPDPLPPLVKVRNMCRDITITMNNDYAFASGASAFQIEGDSELSNVRIFGSFDWTGVDGIVVIDPSYINSDNPIMVDVSTFLVDSPDHPVIFYRDPTFTDIVNLGSRVLSGLTTQRPDPTMCIGTLYVNIDNPAAPVLEWSDGVQWWASAAMT